MISSHRGVSVTDCLGALTVPLLISIDPIQTPIPIQTVGIAVEFCSHIVRWFYQSQQTTKPRRAEDALVHMGTSVISGITITKFLGVFVLLFATSQLFEVRGSTREWGVPWECSRFARLLWGVPGKCPHPSLRWLMWLLVLHGLK